MATTRRIKYQEGIWDFTRSTEIVEVLIKDKDGNDTDVAFDPYKLHISIDPDVFLEENDFNLEIKNQIDALLDDAVDKLIIRGFKIFNLDRLQTRADEIEEELGKLPDEWQDGVLRMLQLPYTLYLHHEFNKKNADDLLQLCLKIEAVLKDIPAGKLNLENSSDIAITQRIIFRTTTVEPKTPRYINATDAKYTPLLRTRGLESDYGQFLSTNLSPKTATASATKNTAAGVNLSAHITASNSPINSKKAVDTKLDLGQTPKSDGSPTAKKK